MKKYKDWIPIKSKKSKPLTAKQIEKNLINWALNLIKCGSEIKDEAKNYE